MKDLAAEYGRKVGRWVTTHEYHRRVLREHMDREAARRAWEAEHEPPKAR